MLCSTACLNFFLFFFSLNYLMVVRKIACTESTFGCRLNETDKIVEQQKAVSIHPAEYSQPLNDLIQTKIRKTTGLASIWTSYYRVKLSVSSFFHNAPKFRNEDKDRKHLTEEEVSHEPS